MAREDDDRRGVSVPKGRISRLARFGGMAAGVAGNMASEGAKRTLRGEKSDARGLLLTPTNAARVAEQLSQLRGAAMKVGQLLSMDGGDLVPPEFAGVMAKLRSQAHHMPPSQLRRVLSTSWGRDWPRRFERFDVHPVAAASIGQVHRGLTKDGRDLAIKVQYPGVRESIDSDVDNVTTLIKMSGLLPKGVDVAPLLAEAKAQLAEEADYEREGTYLERYKDQLEGSPDFAVPSRHEDLTTKDVLAMDFMPGAEIEVLLDASQEERDRVVRLLMDLLLRELFTFRLMQTDPNFANYLYQADTRRLALLDFGATREVPASLSDGYRALLKAGIDEDMDAVREAGIGIGISDERTDPEHEALLGEIFDLVMEPMRHEGPYDFGVTDLAMRIRDTGVALRGGGFNHVPPPQTIFIHRKIGGTYLLATRLSARVDVGGLLRAYLE